MIKIWMILFFMFPVGPAAADETFTLDQYLSAVVEHSKDVELAAREMDLADVRRKEAVSAALPSLGLQSGYTRNLTDYYMYFDMSAIMPGVPGVIQAPIKRDNEFFTSIGLQQTLFSSPMYKTIKAAGQVQQLTEFIYNANLQAVKTGAKKVFYQCLLLEKFWQVTQAAEKNALENHRTMKLKFEQGQVSELALLQAETRWRASITENKEAERNWILSMNVLKNLAGIDTKTQTELDGSFDAVPEMPKEIRLEEVLAHRPDFKALLWQEKLKQTTVEAAKGSFWPTLSWNAAYAYSAQSNRFRLDEENKLWFAGITLSIPLFTGGYRSAQVQKARIELQKTGIHLGKSRESIDKELTDVALRMQEARRRIESAQATRRVAEKAFQISETATRSGLTTQLELKDTRLMFDKATLNYYAALYDYLAAYFDWQYITGQVL